jgi:hypothetical protein
MVRRRPGPGTGVAELPAAGVGSPHSGRPGHDHRSGVLPFHSPYRDANSFNANGDNQVSQTYGLYLGSQLTTRLQFYFEMFQGDGISNGTGPGRPDQWGRHPPRCGAAGQGPRGLLPVPALSSRADKPRLPIHPEPWLQPRSRARACLRWTDPSEFLKGNHDSADPRSKPKGRRFKSDPQRALDNGVTQTELKGLITHVASMPAGRARRTLAVLPSRCSGRNSAAKISRRSPSSRLARPSAVR